MDLSDRRRRNWPPKPGPTPEPTPLIEADVLPKLSTCHYLRVDGHIIEVDCRFVTDAQWKELRQTDPRWKGISLPGTGLVSLMMVTS
jgi:hypothetical protein